MGSYLLIVESNCSDPKREKEFNDWYNNIHIPDVLESSGFKKATRYELKQPVDGKGKHLVLYEMESDNFDTDIALFEQSLNIKREQGRGSSLIKATSKAWYTKTAAFTRKSE
jgi:hypothetical protein